MVSLPHEFNGFVAYDATVRLLETIVAEYPDDVSLTCYEFALTERQDWTTPWPSPVFLAAQGHLEYRGFFAVGGEDGYAYGMSGHILEVGGCIFSMLEPEFVTAHLTTYDGADFFILSIQQRRLVVQLSYSG